ncbi:class II aldolase/adducin family protein [Desulfopila sp. IMCC35008]|uniref:class II aldolase/adducin family protein n=1 Tax=Desulfopila sp. IMCC35008 TaxID=2653858 RepID=UPI0013D7F56F|nr:class II aldolase/adducin family protein [Desulfopila sp. IMCC35008]
METYQGVKFAYRQVSQSCPDHPFLNRLNYWVFLFSQLGLAPVHSTGAYGNQSFRTVNDSFIITKSSMVPEKELNRENYTLVEGYTPDTGIFLTKGASPPSSECFLHHYIYQEDTSIQAIFHGHCDLLSQHAQELGIAVTDKFYDYGTKELAESARLTMSEGNKFFILKDHGFVALGPNLDDAGKLTLTHYMKLISTLSQTLPPEQSESE